MQARHYHHRRPATRLPLLTLVLSALALLTLLSPSEASALCSSTSRCGRSAPCCSSAGYCGSTAPYCLAGCNPSGSLLSSSCAPMPACKDLSLDFTSASSSSYYTALASYNGDATEAPLTFDSGNVRHTSKGLVFELTKANQAVGTQLSSTRYMLYGTMEVVMKHSNHKGVVAAFILMSPTADEIDYELTTANADEVQTNFFWEGQAQGDHNAKTLSASKLPGGSSFDTAAFHTYTVTWSPSSITWLIDGSVVRTVKRSSTKAGASKRHERQSSPASPQELAARAASTYEYPATPSRVQLSLWCAGCKKYNAAGTRAWSGGDVDWSQVDDASRGAFTMTVQSLKITCNTPAALAAYPAFEYEDASGGEEVVGTKRKTTV